MQIKVHRGLHQIGGCITEISTATSRVFIDMGQNLPGICQPTTPEEDQKMVDGIFAQSRKEHEAVFYTHTHDDHIGLFWAVPAEVPQYLGEVSKDFFKAKHELLKKRFQIESEKHETESPEYKEANKKNQRETKLLSIIDKMLIWERSKAKHSPATMHVGDISITPYYCDHSSIEAYMFLIEADGKRIWHTGDFRAHGYLSKNLFKMLKTYACDIDTLIIEGTMLSRMDICITEAKVSERMEQVMKEFKNVFILVSSSDIQRLAAIKAAAYRAHRIQDLNICSGLIKRVIAISNNLIGKQFKLFHFPYINFIKLTNPLPSAGFILPLGVSKIDEVRAILPKLNPDDTVLIYSSWDGYYKDPDQIANNPNYLQFHEMFDNVIDIHTSGHADRDALTHTIMTINPKESIINIHKDPNTTLKSLDISEELKKKIL